MPDICTCCPGRNAQNGKDVSHKISTAPIIYHPQSNKQLMSTRNPCQKLLKLRLYYIIITEKWGANLKWGCISINTGKKLTKRRQLIYLDHRICFYCQESFSLPYIQLLRKDGMHFMKPKKIPFPFNSDMNWVSQNHMQKMCYWEGEGQGSPVSQVHF